MEFDFSFPHDPNWTLEQFEILKEAHEARLRISYVVFLQNPSRAEWYTGSFYNDRDHAAYLAYLRTFQFIKPCPQKQILVELNTEVETSVSENFENEKITKTSIETSEPNKVCIEPIALTTAIEDDFCEKTFETFILKEIVQIVLVEISSTLPLSCNEKIANELHMKEEEKDTSEEFSYHLFLGSSKKKFLICLILEQDGMRILLHGRKILLCVLANAGRKIFKSKF